MTHLRSLLALAETGNLTRAAERLNYAPSSVSAHLRAIEAELGIDLTERSGRGIALTPAGRDFVPHARGIVDAMSAALTNLQATRPSTLMVAAIASIASYALPVIAQQLTGLGIALAMRTVTNCIDNVRGVVEGEHDLGITLQERASIDRVYDRVAYEVLSPVPIIVVVAPSHRLTRVPVLEPSALRGETLIETEAGCSYRAQFEALLEAHGVVAGERFIFEDFNAIRALARAGVGVAVLPRFVVEHDLRRGTLVALPLAVPGEFVMIAAWRREHLTEPLRRVLDVLRLNARAMVAAPIAAR